MGGVASAVGSAVGWVGDAISGVAEFVVDDILSPVIDVVGGVIEGMANDPLGTIMMIGAAATGNPFIIAAAAGANAAIKGGDIGDVLLAAATSYAGSYVGGQIGAEVGSYVGEAAGQTAGAIAEKAASGATRAAISAALTGGDIGNALLMGGLGGAVSGGLSELGSYIKSDLGSTMDVDAFDTDVYEKFGEDFGNTFTSMKTELSDLVDGFKSLPSFAQDMITGGASAAITSLATTGEINPDLVASAITKAGVTTGILKEVISGNELFDPNTKEGKNRTALLTNAVNSVVSSAYSGVDPYQAVMMGFTDTAMKGLVKELSDLGGDALTQVVDRLSGAQTTAEQALDNANTQAAKVDIAAGIANERYDRYKELVDEYNNVTRLSGDKAAGDAMLARIEEARKSYEDAVDAYEPLKVAYDSAITEYNTATTDLVDSNKAVDELMEPINSVITKTVVETLTADASGNTQFNADEYRELYNLAEDVDPYQHWLDTGRQNDISQAARDTAVGNAIQRRLSDVILANVDTKLNSIEDINDLVDNVRASIGNDLISVANSDVVSLAQAYLDGVEARTPTDDIPVTRAEGVTDADIASGEALAIFNQIGGKLGIEFTKQPTLGNEVFDARLNRTVLPVYNTETGQAMYLDPTTKVPIEGYKSGQIQPDGTVVIGERTVTTQPLPAVIPPTLTQLKTIAPVAAITAAGRLAINQEEYDKLDWGTKQLLNFSKAVSEAANNYAIVSDNPDDVYNVKLAAGAALDAGGQLLNAFNGVVTFFKNDKFNPIDARETNLGRVTQAMMQIGTATQPEEYNAVIKDLRQQFRDAEGFGGTVNAIWDGFKEAPAEFLIEFVGKELAQEVPLIVASGGVGLLARGAAGAAQATTQFASKIGAATAWTTNAGLQVLETAGATASETYAELYDTMVKMGVAPEQAAVKAQEGAILNGITAAVIEGSLGRLFDPGDVLAKKIAGGQDALLNTALNNIARRGAGIAGEGTSEGIEEASTQYLKIAMLEKIDPTITQAGGRYADMGGVLAEAGVLGAIAGTGTAAGITVGDAIYSAVQNGTYTGGDTNIPASFWTEQAQLQLAPPSTNIAANSLILLNPTISQAVANANAPDVDPDVRAQAQQTIKDTLNWGSFFDDQGQVLDFSQDADGAWSYQTATDILNAANDNAYTTYDEAQQAYQAITVPNLGGAEYTGAEGTLGLDDDWNLGDPTIPSSFVYAENRQRAWKELNPSVALTPYTITEEDLGGLTGEVPDADIGQRVIEAANRGYATQIFEQEGYTPEEADYLAASSLAESGVLTEALGTQLATLYDPRAVTQEEAQQAFEELGFYGALPGDVQKLIGQYDESELAGKAKEQLPVASYNAIAELIGKPAQQVTGTDIDFVADLIAQQEAMTQPVALTAQQKQYDVNNDNVVDINDQIALQNLMQYQQTGQVIGTGAITSTTSPFAASGIVGQLANLRTGMQQQQQMQNVQQMYGLLQQQASPGNMSKVTTAEGKPIEYFFDPITSESIFATPKQAGMFVNPYESLLAASTGGLIEDKTDEIMRIVGGKK